jgi:hypothetical protein
METDDDDLAWCDQAAAEGFALLDSMEELSVGI